MDERIAREAEAVEFGQSLSGLGINLVVSDVERAAQFLQQVFDMTIYRSDRDFGVIGTHGTVFQLHADHTYSSNPLLSLLPENGARGGGAELRLYNMDPDLCEKRALDLGYVVLRGSEDRPHGLRECFILDPDGYCWVPGAAI
ncbi:VOC family protein [Coralliovum pocilloporae]|uniref:VOC family protein n=1 Tax=Coralliovum pocilloporae TaxID=3066369 RepID=UPI0033075ED7